MNSKQGSWGDDAETDIVSPCVYAATKAAVRSLARTLSAELVGHGARVNTVSPRKGVNATPFKAGTAFYWMRQRGIWS